MKKTELNRIKEAIKEFKYMREDVKSKLKIITKKYKEELKEYGLIEDESEFCERYGKLVRSFSVEDNSKAYFENKDRERIKKDFRERMDMLRELSGQDTHIYIIYKDGSTASASGDEISFGEANLKLSNIVYAHYNDEYEEFDTDIGDIYIGLFDKTLEELDYELTEEMEEQKEQYFKHVEVKYGTDWGKRYQNIA